MNETHSAANLGRFLTIADAAQQLSVSTTQVYNLVRSGELPAIKVGGHWRIEATVLASFIDSKYEESRRIGLWNQSEFAGISEFSFDSRN